MTKGGEILKESRICYPSNRGFFTADTSRYPATTKKKNMCQSEDWDLFQGLNRPPQANKWFFQECIRLSLSDKFDPLS